MDDPELEQFVLGDSSSTSSESCSPIDTMSCPSPQTSPQVSTPGSIIYPQDPLRDIPSSPPFSCISVPCSTVESLPPISHLSPSSPFQHMYSANHDILNSKHGQSVMSMDSHIPPANMFDLNGNIQETHNTVPHYSDYREPEYGEQCYQQSHIAHNDHSNYNTGYYPADHYIYAMPTSCHDQQAYQWSYDSEDSFEVENDHVFPEQMQRTQQYSQIIRNQHHSISCEEGSSLPNFSVFTTEMKKVPSRRGRPVTYNKPGYHYSDSDGIPSDEDDRSGQSKGCRRGAKNILLWKFLLGELRKPNSNHIKWENEREGIFKFVDTAECSRLWGQMKKKEDMNFEKLSRGIRHYYKDGLMSRRDGIRLVYKFNWDRVPRAFWPRRR
ncbi:uncharacterized protein LOC132742533 [Ruditapes philippinarum]|uniref:uncharacterized protein LOC132742533 n=1 Tax=Ruditapes philippinarum TaxID=129788 RepID=UPI00295AF2FC|nr:uncharacterized protein LOC132742533 [Ruditapes philippinarum]